MRVFWEAKEYVFSFVQLYTTSDSANCFWTEFSTRGGYVNFICVGEVIQIMIFTREGNTNYLKYNRK